jgi:hypothetical protein
MDSISQARVPLHFLLRFGLAYDAGTDTNGDTAHGNKPGAKSSIARLAFLPTPPSYKSVTSYVVANHTVMPVLQKRAGSLVNTSHRTKFARMTGLSGKKLMTKWNLGLPAEVLSGLRKVVVDEISACVDLASPTGTPPEESSAMPATTSLFVEYSKNDSLHVESLACLMCVNAHAAGSDLPHKVSKYDLPHLLGVELAAEVVQTIGLSEMCAIGVIKHARVTPLLLALERLQMYIA